MRHRIGGPAIIRPGGEQLWYSHNLLHRRDGPAYENGNHREWYDSGRLHRVGGPAVEGHGDPEQNWWEFGVQKPAPEPPGTPIEVKLGTNKLRQLRDNIEARGGTLSRKDLPQQLPPELKPLLGPRGDLSAHSIQEFLDKKPGLKFETTEAEWQGGQRHNGSPSKVMQLNVTPGQRQAMQAAGVDKTFDSMMDASRQSNHPVKKNTVGWVRYTHAPDIDELNREAANAFPMEYAPNRKFIQESRANYVKHKMKDPSIFMDEVQSDFGQSFGKRAQAEARQQALEEIPGQPHPEYLTSLEQAANGGRMSDDQVRDRAEWLVGRYGDAMGYDKNTGEDTGPTEEDWNAAVENRMDEILGDENVAHGHAKAAVEHARNGDFDSARHAANAASSYGHNYQPLVELAEEPQTIPPDIDSLTPEQQQHIEAKVAAARDAAEAKWPEAHQQKINEILFGGRHPNEVLHEAFHEHMRQRGHVGTPISIWTPESKAPQSQLDPDKPVPAHMKFTYDQVPRKMGMQASTYGYPSRGPGGNSSRPAESGNHYNDPVWADVIRKREPQLKHIAALAVINPRGELLFQKRRDNGRWTQPAGHLDPHESPEAGARRELLEETNLVPHRCEYLGSGSPQGKDIVVHCYRAHVDGIPSAKNDPDREASEFRWVDTGQGLPEEIADNLHSPDNVLLKLLGLQNDVHKSEALQKAPSSWNESPARLEEFAHDNLGPQSSRLVHAGTHQLSPSAWVHKYEEPKAFKLTPGSTRRLTEYRITNSREPSHERALAILGGTAHDDNGVKKFRVSSFAVHTRARRHGIGKVLYEHVLRDNGGRTESDTMVSPSAQGFYEGLARDKRFRVKFGDDTADTRHGVELSKSLKNSFMALATVAGMAAPGVVNAHEPKLAPVAYHHEENMSPAPPKQKWGPEGLAPELFPIAHLESNMGQNMDHAKHSKGEFHTAFGALGMKPITAFERYHHEPHLQQLFPGVGEDKDKFLTEFKSNPLLYNSLASAEFNHNKKVFGGDIHRAVFSWRWGLQAAHDAPAANVIADPYVATFDKLNNRLKSRQELAKSTGVRIEHYSNVPGLQELKPRFQGTGLHRC